MTESLIQQFATYLARFATQGMKSGSPLISYNTADTILSQVKVSIQMHYGVHESLLFLEGSSWARIRSSMKSIYTIRNISAGLPMMTPHAAASADDLIALSKVCYWAGDENAANAVLFLQSLVQCVGRGSDVAMNKHDDIRLAPVQETQQLNILKIRLWRQKTSHEQVPGLQYTVRHFRIL
ncbi:hypothetical protein AC1031_006018 [Aphanomyces cochlioides]|nr:hypothetical protein AC1031_006018 [Aphanomyces cochlioides]